MAVYYLLFLLYATVPPVTLFYCLKWTYKDDWKYGWHLFYFFKWIFTISFLPLFVLPELSLGLVPINSLSLIFLFATIVLAIIGIPYAIRKRVLYFYLGGVYASVMEEILYRSVLFALALKIWGNMWAALIVTSFLFGTWHLKNYYWSGRKGIISQFFYTALMYGPIFALMRIVTGDIYLAVFFHFITDATCALAPDWMRGWLVKGGKGGNYSDDYPKYKKKSAIHTAVPQ